MPGWSRARKDRQSFFQQMIGAPASELDDIIKKAGIALRGRFINTVSLSEVDVLYETRLGKNFEFQYDNSDFRIPKLLQPNINVVINEGDSQTQIDIASTNSIEDFWYDSIPTRLTVDPVTLSYQSVLSESEIGIEEFSSFNDIYEPGYLFVTIKDGTEFSDIDTKEQGYIKISGTNRRGTYDTEIIPFIYNSTIITLKEWRSVSAIHTFNIGPSSATIKVDAITFNYNDYQYNSERYIDEFNTDKTLYLSSEEVGGKSFLKYEVVTANTVQDLLAGVNTKHEVDKVRLLASSQSDLTGILDITVQPDATRCYMLTDTQIIIYDTRPVAIDYSKLTGKTSDSEVLIYIDNEYSLEGDTVKLKPERHMNTKRIIKYKWDLEKPDGSMSTFVYDSVTGDFLEQAYIVDGDYSGWNKNPYETTNSNNFYHRSLDYTIGAVGEYVWTLSIQYLDGSVDVDKRVLVIKTITPLVELDHGIPNVTGVAFNSDYELCILDSSSTSVVHKVNLYHDTAMLDIENKILYTREEYFSIDVAY